MAANPALFQALADALGKPSKTYRAATEALQIPGQAIGGYMDVMKQKQAMDEAKLKPYEIYGKIAEQAGPDVANGIFQKAGIPVPDMGAAGASGVPQTPQQLAGMGKFGQNRLTALNAAQSLEEGAPSTPDEVNALFADHPEVAQRLNTAYGGKVPKWAIQSEKTALTSGMRLEPLIAQKDRALNWQKWNTVLKQANAFTQGSGPVGIASKNNMRGMRAMALINKPGPLTPQEYDYITSDMAGIMQGGAPLAEQVRDQGFNTALGSIAQTLTRLKSEPQAVNTPEIRALLKTNLQHVLNVDNAVINNNLGYLEKAYPDVIAQNRPAWEAAKQAIQRGEQMPVGDMGGGGDMGTGDPEADAAIAQIMAAPIDDAQKQARVSAVRARAQGAQ